MGCVYKAMHTRLKKVVALKMLPAKDMNHPEAIARFQREMEAVGRFDHPNIVRGTDAGETDGYHYLVMELLEGIDLGKLTNKLGPLRVADACELLRQAAVGLAYIHQHGVVHRDIKPSNLFLTTAGEVKLLDLGLARLPPIGTELEEFTASGQLLGTADYMAPEQVWDPREVDIRADLYSLGCSLYRLLSGCPPFSGPSYDTYYKKINAHTQVPVPPIQNFRSDLPVGLIDVLDRLLSKKPHDRLASPKVVAEALASYTSGANAIGLLEVAGSSPARTLDVASAASTIPRQPSPSTSEAAAGTPTVTLPGKKIRHLRWYLMGLFFIVGASAAAVFLRDRSPDENAPPKNLDNSPLLVWQNLLATRPAVAYWPKNMPDGHWKFDDKKQEIFVVTPQHCMLALGATSREEYKLRVSMVQTDWTGDMGIFFGWQEFEENGMRCQQCQLVELHRYMARLDPMKGFQMRRQKVTVRHVPNQGPSISYSDIIGGLAIPMPKSSEETLEIQVNSRGLTSVIWSGDLIPHLVTPEANGKYAPREYQGAFGIYSYRNSSAFRDAKFMLLERNQP